MAVVIYHCKEAYLVIASATVHAIRPTSDTSTNHGSRTAWLIRLLTARHVSTLLPDGVDLPCAKVYIRARKECRRNPEKLFPVLSDVPILLYGARARHMSSRADHKNVGADQIA